VVPWGGGSAPTLPKLLCVSATLGVPARSAWLFVLGKKAAICAVLADTLLNPLPFPLALLSLRAAALLLALGCGAVSGNAAEPSPAALPGEQVLEHGGELREQWPERSLEVTPDVVHVWGVSEVPDGSRLQLALSGVDAITRSELLKAVSVRVQSVLHDVESNTPERRALSLQTTESVAGVLERAGPLPHGWARVQRGERVVLRLWARLTLSRSELETALRGALASSNAEASGFVAGLALAPKESAP
jgi:hypothetical protein